MFLLKWCPNCEPTTVHLRGDMTVAMSDPGVAMTDASSAELLLEELSVEMTECSEIEFVVPPPPPPPPRMRLEIPEVPRPPSEPAMQAVVTMGVDYLGSTVCCMVMEVFGDAGKDDVEMAAQQRRRRKFASEFAEQLRASAGDSDDSEDEYDLGELAEMARTNREELFSSVQQLRKVSEELERELNARSSFASKLFREPDATPSGENGLAPVSAALSVDEEENDFEDFDEARFELLMRSMGAGKEDEEEPISLEDMSRSGGFGCYLEPILEENSDDLRSDLDDSSSSCTSSSESSCGKDSTELFTSNPQCETRRSGRENLPSLLPPRRLDYNSDVAFTSSSGEEDDEHLADDEILRSTSPYSAHSVKSERDIAVPKKRRKLSPSFMDQPSKDHTPTVSGDEEDSGTQTMSNPKDCASSSSSSSSSSSPHSYVYGSSSSSLATPEMLSSSSSSRASKMGEGLAGHGGKTPTGEAERRASLSAREMSKFAVLLSPSVVDRIRMFRSCGDLMSLDEKEEAIHGSRHDASSSPTTARALQTRRQDDSWFPLSQLLKPILNKGGSDDDKTREGEGPVGAPGSLRSTSHLACTAREGASSKAVAIGAAAVSAGVCVLESAGALDGAEKVRSRLATRSGDALSDDSGYGDCNVSRARRYPNSTISRLQSEQAPSGLNIPTPSPRTSRRIRLANLLTRDRERQVDRARTLGIPRYSLTADDPWVDKIKRFSSSLDQMMEGESSGDEPLSFERFQEKVDAVQRMSAAVLNNSVGNSGVKKPRPKPRSKRPMSMIDCVWSSTPKEDSDEDPRRASSRGEESSSGEWQAQGSTLMCTCVKGDKSEEESSAMLPQDGAFSEAHDSLLITKTNYPQRFRHHRPARRHAEPPRDLPLANGYPGLFGEDPGHSSGEDTAASDARRRQPISPELAREFLMAEGIFDDSLLLTNYPGMGLMDMPYQQLGDPMSSYFFGGSPLRASVSAPSLTAPDLGIPVLPNAFDDDPIDRDVGVPRVERGFEHQRPVSQMMTAAEFSNAGYPNTLWGTWQPAPAYAIREFGAAASDRTPAMASALVTATTFANPEPEDIPHFPPNYIWAEPDEEDHLYVFPGGAWEGHSYFEGHFVLDESADQADGTETLVEHQFDPAWIDQDVGIPVRDVWSRGPAMPPPQGNGNWLHSDFRPSSAGSSVKSSLPAQFPSQRKLSDVIEDPLDAVVPGEGDPFEGFSDTFKRDFGRAVPSGSSAKHSEPFATSTPIHEANQFTGKNGRASTSPVRSVRFSPTISEIFMIETSEPVDTPMRPSSRGSGRRLPSHQGDPEFKMPPPIIKPTTLPKLPPVPNYAPPPPPPPAPTPPPRSSSKMVVAALVEAEPTVKEVCRISELPNDAGKVKPPVRSVMSAQNLLAAASKIEECIGNKAKAMQVANNQDPSKGTKAPQKPPKSILKTPVLAETTIKEPVKEVEITDDHPTETDLDAPAKEEVKENKQPSPLSERKFASTLDISQAVKRRTATVTSSGQPAAKPKQGRPLSMINPTEARISGESLQHAFEQFRKQAQEDRQRLAENVKNLHSAIETSVRSAVKRPQMASRKEPEGENEGQRFVMAASEEMRRSSQEIDKQWEDILSKSKIKTYGKMAGGRSKSQTRSSKLSDDGSTSGSSVTSKQWPSAAQYFSDRQRSTSESSHSETTNGHHGKVQVNGSMDHLDSGEILFLRETHLDGRLNGTQEGNTSPKSRSMTDLNEETAEGSLHSSSRIAGKSSKRSSPTNMAGEPSRAKSLEFLLDEDNKEKTKVPENTLTKEDRQLSEHEVRFKTSLQRLNIPDWFMKAKAAAKEKDSKLAEPGLRSSRRDWVKPGGWEAMKRSSASSLQSSRATTPTRRSSVERSRNEWRYSFHRDQVNHDYSALSSPVASTRSHEPFFSKWNSSSSATGSRQSRSTSPASQTSAGGSSFTSGRSFLSNNTTTTTLTSNGQKPYLGWRSQDKLDQDDGIETTKPGQQKPKYLSATERLTQSMLPANQTVLNSQKQQQSKETKTEKKETKSTEHHYKEDVNHMINEILHFCKETKKETYYSSRTESVTKIERPVPVRRKQTDSDQQATPSGASSNLWMESSFLGIPVVSTIEEETKETFLCTNTEHEHFEERHFVPVEKMESKFGDNFFKSTFGEDLQGSTELWL